MVSCLDRVPVELALYGCPVGSEEVDTRALLLPLHEVPAHRLREHELVAVLLADEVPDAFHGPSRNRLLEKGVVNVNFEKGTGIRGQ